MASNRELAAEIAEMSATLGIETDTSGMNKAKLTELHESLAGQLSGEPAPKPEEVSEAERPLDEPKVMVGDGQSYGGPPAQVVNPPEPVHSLEVAPGKAVTSPRGMLREYAKVEVSDFDKVTMERLIAIGCIRKR